MGQEKLIELECKKYIELLGGWAIKISQPSGHARNIKGIPDLICILNGIVRLIEVKSETGKQSIEQVEFEKKWTMHGGSYLLVHSVRELADKLGRTVS